MADLPTLSPCPHCGEPGEYRTDEWGGKTRFRTVCANPNCQNGCKFFDASEAAAHWNRRTTSAASPCARTQALTDEQIISIAHAQPKTLWHDESRQSDVIRFARALLAAQPATTTDTGPRRYLLINGKMKEDADGNWMEVPPNTGMGHQALHPAEAASVVSAVERNATQELTLRELDAIGQSYFNGPLNSDEEMFGRAVERIVRQRLTGAGLDEAQRRRMVDRFLGWKLPRTFSPDAGIKFTPSNGMTREEAYEKPGWWPIGTNLLTADEAHAMVEHMLADDKVMRDAALSPTPAPKE